MKTRLPLLLVPTLIGALHLAPALPAQTPPEKQGRRVQTERHARWANLTEEERTKLKAAHQKALSDPEVRAARDRLKQARLEFREVLRPALLKADPTIQPILDKMRSDRSMRD